MKKFLCLIIIFTLTASLISCENKESGSPTNTETNETIDTSKPVITDPPATPPMTTQNYTEYLNFIETTDLPDNFVTYDQIKGFGEFCYFALHNPDICNSYYYFVKQGEYGGYIITLNSSETLSSIISGKTTFSVTDIEELLFPEGLNGIRYKNDLPEKVYLLFSDILYVYEENELNAIYWENNGTLYKLEGNFHRAVIRDYGLVSKILVLDTAAEVLDEIKSWSDTTETEATE